MLEFVGLAPAGSSKVHSILEKDADALVEGGRWVNISSSLITIAGCSQSSYVVVFAHVKHDSFRRGDMAHWCREEIFTPMYFFLVRKPLSKSWGARGQTSRLSEVCQLWLSLMRARIGYDYICMCLCPYVCVSVYVCTLVVAEHYVSFLLVKVSLWFR